MCVKGMDTMTIVLVCTTSVTDAARDCFLRQCCERLGAA
jgi:hypothetical protein